MNPAIHAAHHRNYLPAAGRDVFPPAYDFVTRSMGAGRVRNAFVQQAGIQPGLRIPDIGCGAGTLAIFANARIPSSPSSVSTRSQRARATYHQRFLWNPDPHVLPGPRSTTLPRQVW